MASATSVRRRVTKLNRGAMVFGSQGCEPLETVPRRVLNGGAVALWVCPGNVVAKPMPSLRDSRFVLGTPTRGLHPWLSNDTALPLITNTFLPLITNTAPPLEMIRMVYLRTCSMRTRQPRIRNLSLLPWADNWNWLAINECLIVSRN